jgi:hypothetical protein
VPNAGPCRTRSNNSTGLWICHFHSAELESTFTECFQ